MKGQVNGPAYTAEEITAIKAGATSLPGRSMKSFRRARRIHAPGFARQRFVWTPAILARCAADPHYVPEGTTRRRVLEALRRRDIEHAIRDAPDGHAVWNRKPDRKPLARSVAAAAPKAPGADLLLACYALWPSGRMDDLAQDIISEMVLGVIDGRFDRNDLIAARRAARAIVRKSHPEFGHAPLRLEDPMPGFHGMAVIDCLRAP